MKYIYDLTKQDLKQLKIKTLDNAVRYFAIQDGWNGKISGVYATIEKNGCNYDMTLMEGDQLTEQQCDMIIKKLELRWV